MAYSRLVILDPAFVATEGHHLSANMLLVETAERLGMDTILVCSERSTLTRLGDTRCRLLKVFASTPYGRWNPDTPDTLASINRKTYEECRRIDPELLTPETLVLIHTTNETQIYGLCQWLAERRNERPFAMNLSMMFPSGIELDAGGAISGVIDPMAALAYHRGLSLLAPHWNDVRLMGIGRAIAAEFAALMGRRAGCAPAILQGLGQPLPEKPAPVPPNVILSLGDTKIDKGLLLLTGMSELIGASDLDAHFTIQVSGSVATKYKDVTERLIDMASAEPRIHLLQGRQSLEDYSDRWKAAHLATLMYDPKVYRYKTSGLCWEAMNYAVPSIVLRGSWHEREFRSYGFEPIVVDGYWAEPIFDALAGALRQVESLGAAWLARREDFARRNRPELFFSDDVDVVEPPREERSIFQNIPDWRVRMFDAALGPARAA